LFVLILLAIPTKVNALSANHAVLIEVTSGKVLLEKNAYKRAAMASTTKIMTGWLALELGNPTDIVTVSANAANTEGSSMWLAEGEKIPLIDLIYGLMLNSGNDAATAIAEHIAGNTEEFAKLMTQRATDTGLKNTNFTNPHGLANDSHYTTAYDLAMITREALKNSEFAEIVATKTKIVSWEGHDYGRTLQNHNKMLVLYEGADGIKTGFTKASGRCLVSSATRNGMQLIAVTLNAPSDWNDHATMLDFGFANYSYKKILSTSDIIKTVPVENSAITYLPTVTSEDIYLLLPNKDSQNIKIQYNLPDSVSAPILQKQTLGELTITLNGAIVTHVPLISNNDVPENINLQNNYNNKKLFKNIQIISWDLLDVI